MNIEKKNIGILGLGISGYWAAKLANSMGANVFVSELNNKSLYDKELEKLDIELEVGEHSEKILNCDLIIKSPGVPNNSEIVKKIKRNHIKIMGEMEFAYQNSDIKIVAVTGTNGKTTVVTALYEILKKSRNVLQGGNIGTPFSQLVFENQLNKKHNFDFAVLEVSSYQSEDFISFKPNIGLILNCEDDHIDVHGSYENYIEAKLNLFNNMDKEDYAIYNYDEEGFYHKFKNLEKQTNVVPFDFQSAENSMYYYSSPNLLKSSEDKRVRLWPSRLHQMKNPNKERGETDFFSVNKGHLHLNGKHDIENFIAVATVCSIIGINENETFNYIKNFKGLEHRFEIFKEVENSQKQIIFINDSKSTNGLSVRSALNKCFGLGKRNVALILGGKSKKINYADYVFFPYGLSSKYIRVVAYGESAEEIKSNLSLYDHQVDIVVDFKNAVYKSIDIANQFKYGAVLLSPGGSSFDQFDNFEHRGKVFKDIVEEYYS